MQNFNIFTKMKKKHITDKIYPTSPPSEPVPNRFREGRGAFIGIFGRRNTGKSSLINLLTGQDIAIVSDKPGTTTDPVSKSVEIFGIGPVVLIDTAGIDDAGELGEKRIKKSKEAIKKADCAILVIAENTFDNFELDLIKLLITTRHFRFNGGKILRRQAVGQIEIVIEAVFGVGADVKQRIRPEAADGRRHHVRRTVAHGFQRNLLNLHEYWIMSFLKRGNLPRPPGKVNAPLGFMSGLAAGFPPARQTAPRPVRRETTHAPATPRRG